MPCRSRDKKGLIIGIANSQSVAYGCAKAFTRAGASLAVTYLNAKAEPYVRPLAECLECPIVVPCDVREPGQLEAVFARIKEAGDVWTSCFIIAYAPRDLRVRRRAGHGLGHTGRVAALAMRLRPSKVSLCPVGWRLQLG